MILLRTPSKEKSCYFFMNAESFLNVLIVFNSHSHKISIWNDNINNTICRSRLATHYWNVFILITLFAQFTQFLRSSQIINETRMNSLNPFCDLPVLAILKHDKRCHVKFSILHKEVKAVIINMQDRLFFNVLI